jgi:hypothetical protein
VRPAALAGRPKGVKRVHDSVAFDCNLAAESALRLWPR